MKLIEMKVFIRNIKSKVCSTGSFENIINGSVFRTHDHKITFQYHFSNPNFDYGEFRQLEDLILNGIDVTFDKAGFQIDNSSSRSLY